MAQKGTGTEGLGIAAACLGPQEAIPGIYANPSSVTHFVQQPREQWSSLQQIAIDYFTLCTECLIHRDSAEVAIVRSMQSKTSAMQVYECHAAAHDRQVLLLASMLSLKAAPETCMHLGK